jgi:PRTRC genetic system protein E
MFKALHQLAQDSPIALLLSAEGENLRVTVTQKKSVGGPPLMLSVVGAPDELDTDFAREIGFAAVNVSDHVPVKEQLRSQLDGGKTLTGKSNTPDAVEKAKATPVAASTADAKPKAPNKTERKQACLDEFVRLNREHLQTQGKPIGRETFIEKSETKRDFERLFGNWTKFRTAGEKAAEKAADAERADAAVAPDTSVDGAVDDQTLSLPLDTASAIESTDAGAAAGDGGDDTSSSAAARTPQWKVELDDGTVLFEAQETAVFGQSAIIPHAGLDHVVTELIEEDHRCVVRRKFRDVVLADGTVVGSEVRAVEPGDEVTLGDVAHTVLRATSLQIIVEPPPPPPKVRNIIDDEGEKVGVHTGETKLGAELSTDSGIFTVVRVTEKAIFAEPAHTTAEA